jgi:hypothetical protein
MRQRKEESGIWSESNRPSGPRKSIIARPRGGDHGKQEKEHERDLGVSMVTTPRKKAGNSNFRKVNIMRCEKERKRQSRARRWKPEGKEKR